ncbi:MAG: DUF4097 family beta strand repeat-containing protein [Candidatus Zhuqueibacterota bacterium]
MHALTWKNFCLAVVFLTATLVHASDDFTKHFSKTVEFKSAGDIQVTSVNGQIKATAWDSESVKIEAEIKVRARSQRDADRIMEKVTIVVEQTGGHLTIEADYPRHDSDSGFWNTLFTSGRTPVIHFTIKAPRQSNLDLHSTNGNIFASSVRGKNSMRTTNGNIEVENMEGSLELYSTNGSVTAEATDFQETDAIRMKTTNGNATLSLPATVRANVNASTVNGSVRTDFPLTIRGKVMKHRIEGDIDGGGGKIDISTVNGNVKILEQ